MLGAYVGLLISVVDIVDSAVKTAPTDWRSWVLLSVSVLAAWGRRYATALIAGWLSSE